MTPVVVVGTCFVDIKCFPDARLDYQGRNVGQVVFQHGGVGRNVVETLARLHNPVRFISSVSQDGLGDEVIERLAALQADVSGIARLPRAGHGLWVAILEADGDLACSVSQQFDFSGIKQSWRQHRGQMLDGAGLVVLEIDMDRAVAAMVLEDAAAAGVPVFALPSNFAVMREHPELLHLVHTLICNLHEAELLLGHAAAPDTIAEQVRRRFDLQRAVVTLGAGGAVASDQGEGVHQVALSCPVVDTTGAGDAFVAGFTAASLAGMATADALACAVRVAGWTVASAESVCTDLELRVGSDDWPGWRRLAHAHS